MEAEGLRLLLQKYHDITMISYTLTTDRHVQVRRVLLFLKKEYPQIVRQFWKNFKEETYCSSKEEDQRRTFTLDQINS